MLYEICYVMLDSMYYVLLYNMCYGMLYNILCYVLKHKPMLYDILSVI